MFKLPEEWIVTSIKDVATLVNGDRGKDYPNNNDQLDEGYCLFLNTKNVRQGFFSFKEPKFITEERHNKLRNGTLQRNDLVLTIRGTLGNSAVYSDEIKYSVVRINSAMMILRPFIISPFFVMRLFRENSFLRWAQKSHRGTAQPHLRASDINEYSIPLPPLAEQKVIAVKLDSLLSQVEQIKCRIDAVPAILKKFRQSVLAAAVSGKLTEAWRGSEELVGWEEKKLSDISNSISDGDHQAPPKVAEGIPFLVISNVSSGKIEFEKVERWVPEEYYQNLKDIRKPQKNDILFTVTGSFGIPVVVETDQAFCFQRHIGIIKPNNEIVDNRFLFYSLSSIQTYKQAEAVATGTAQKTVPLRGLRSINIPIPPLEEQKEIVRQVEKLFAFANTIEARVTAAQSRVDNLTQSILAKAFRGDLTKEWREANRDLITGENSATVLLERIKEEWETLAPKKKRAVRKKK